MQLPDNERFKFRQSILKFEQKLKDIPGSYHDTDEICPVKHYLCENQYVREMFIPKGVVLVGEIHRYAHPSFLLQGEISILTETETFKKVKAPFTTLTPAYTKRIGLAHTDCVWSTVHITNKKNIDEIEKELIAPYFEDEIGDDKIENIIKLLKGLL